MTTHPHIPLCPAELRRIAVNRRLISENQQEHIAEALEWAAGEIERLTPISAAVIRTMSQTDLINALEEADGVIAKLEVEIDRRMIERAHEILRQQNA